MSATRLLLVTDAVGGVWTYSLELARALRPLGIEAVLAVMGPAPTRRQLEATGEVRIIDTGLPLDWLERDPGKFRSAGEALADIARLECADIVQVNSAALLADCKFDQPCVAVQHSCVASWWAAVRGTPLRQDFAWRRDLTQAGLDRASAVVTPSIAFAAETARIYDVGNAAGVVHNGRRSPSPRPLPEGQFVFTASRLWDEGKNVATLDAAAARLEVPFQAAGATRGPNGASIAFDHLHALGELGEARLGALFAARPIFASAAVYEPFGLSVLEAGQAGCALVLSDIPTHREIWDGAAIFVPARDAEAFAGAIQDLLDDRDERQALGQLARTQAKLYSPERMARGMAEIYARVVRPHFVPTALAGAA
jgi:glycosyltransferase involved in cell wall biosynthesis